jgi:hypothetical protein
MNTRVGSNPSDLVWLRTWSFEMDMMLQLFQNLADCVGRTKEWINHVYKNAYCYGFESRL